MALEAGVHVLVEKPLCLARDEFDSLRAAAAERGRVLMCVHNWKHAATYRLAHDLVSAGRLGEIRYLALDRLRIAPAGIGTGASGRWRMGGAGGGGILVDHGWHVFYLMRWLMGGADPAAITAFLGAGSQAAQDDSAVEEVADLRVLFPGNRIASAHLSWRPSGARVRRSMVATRRSKSTVTA
jgi:predicted dehydrogenase